MAMQALKKRVEDLRVAAAQREARLYFSSRLDAPRLHNCYQKDPKFGHAIKYFVDCRWTLYSKVLPSVMCGEARAS